MTIQQAIETVRIALGDRDEHHPMCNFYKAVKDSPCDCYAMRRQVPHKAMDQIEKVIAEYAELLKKGGG